MTIGHDMTPSIDPSRQKSTGPVRTKRPVYVDLLPPCNIACPAGENVQAWLAFAQASKFREAWETLVRDNNVARAMWEPLACELLAVCLLERR